MDSAVFGKKSLFLFNLLFVESLHIAVNTLQIALDLLVWIVLHVDALKFFKLKSILSPVARRSVGRREAFQVSTDPLRAMERLEQSLAEIITPRTVGITLGDFKLLALNFKLWALIPFQEPSYNRPLQISNCVFLVKEPHRPKSDEHRAGGLTTAFSKNQKRSLRTAESLQFTCCSRPELLAPLPASITSLTSY